MQRGVHQSRAASAAAAIATAAAVSTATSVTALLNHPVCRHLLSV